MYKLQIYSTIVSLSFILWGLIVVISQFVFLTIKEEFRKLLFSCIYISGVFLINIFYLIDIIRNVINNNISYSPPIILQFLLILITIIYIITFDTLLIKKKLKRDNLKIFINLSLLFLFEILIILFKLNFYFYNHIFFILFLLIEITYLKIHSENKISELENNYIIFSYFLLIILNLIGMFIKELKDFGIGLMGIIIPIYYILKFMDFKYKLKEKILIINSLIKDEKFTVFSSIKIIVDMLESKNEFIRGHSERVSFLATLIGTHIGLDSRELEDLQNAALLHDIGYIGVNIDKLIIQSVYSEVEFEELKKHSIIGYEILSKSSSLSRYAETVLYHHENWNGTGYPTGLKGLRIPLHSRIIQIADTFDILTSDSFFRSALSKEDALLTIVYGKGEEFDPHLVDILVKVIKV